MPVGPSFRNQAGFTLVEVIVVAAILAILAGILVPMIFNQIDEAKLARALGDTKSIANAVLVFRKDTSQWPDKGVGCAATVTLLTGQGNLPTNLNLMGFDATVSLPFDEVLSQDSNGCWPLAGNVGWKGPYLPATTADPWGNSYIAGASGFRNEGTSIVLILSAGPNGQIDTPNFSYQALGDDVGTVVK